mmetsp:Transcript_116938/g.327201  ORF Transcript_116938/g.327201 Transcript_116938/m.327201 type:complete len:257 (+) Transcript_116938:315-1085(+)
MTALCTNFDGSLAVRRRRALGVRLRLSLHGPRRRQNARAVVGQLRVGGAAHQVDQVAVVFEGEFLQVARNLENSWLQRQRLQLGQGALAALAHGLRRPAAVTPRLRVPHDGAVATPSAQLLRLAHHQTATTWAPVILQGDMRCARLIARKAARHRHVGVDRRRHLHHLCARGQNALALAAAQCWIRNAVPIGYNDECVLHGVEHGRSELNTSQDARKDRAARNGHPGLQKESMRATEQANVCLRKAHAALLSICAV